MCQLIWCLLTESFNKYDVDHSGCIDAWELKEAMKSLGQNPSDEELFALLAQVDSVKLTSKLACLSLCTESLLSIMWL